MKTLGVLLVLLLCVSGLAFAQNSLDTKVEVVTRILQVTPSDDAILAASRWPKFSGYPGGIYNDCYNKAVTHSLKYKGPLPNLTPVIPTLEPVPGLVLVANIDKAYAKGNILITWTLRVEGVGGDWINPHVDFDCSVTPLTQEFKGGEFYSQAFVSTDGINYAAKCQAAVMTMPDGKTTIIFDPTHSGSCQLKASDFPDGNIPAKIWVQIRWKNDTSLKVISKAKYRSLMITLLPPGK